MQIDVSTAYRRQMDFVTEAGRESCRSFDRQQKNGEVTPDQQAEQQAQAAETFQASEEGLLKLYLEQVKNAQMKAKSDRDARAEELKAIKIAHNIMRGYKVPPQDESFLLTKNFKMYMAAKNLSMMRECQGEAKSELGGGRSGSAADAVLAESAGSAGIAAEGLNMGAAETAIAGSGGKQDESKSAVAFKNNSFYDYGKYLESVNRQYNYGQSVSVSAAKKKKAKTRKRFFYNFKDVSSRIVRARTSGNARQAYTSAKLKCGQLRRKIRSGEYDDEALRIALIHAEAMERVAKKKMHHLMEEEMAKRGGLCAGDTDREDIEEQMREDEQVERDRRYSEENGLVQSRDSIDDVSLEEIMADSMQTDVQMLDLVSGMDMFIEEFAELMKDTTEELTGLGELAEELMGVSATPDMDPEDLKELKLKHRTEEQRKIAEADSKYLRALFQKLQREQQAVAQGAAKVAEAIAGNGGGAVLSLTGASPSSGRASGVSAAAGAGKGTSSSVASAPVELVSLSAAKESLSSNVTAVSSGEAAAAVATASISFDVSV